jgi:hypothetical protein
MPTKYKGKTAIYKGVGGFFFLRLMCPSITNPHVYGLLENPPDETVQRYLVLLSKILQSIANGKFIVDNAHLTKEHFLVRRSPTWKY